MGFIIGYYFRYNRSWNDDKNMYLNSTWIPENKNCLNRSWIDEYILVQTKVRLMKTIFKLNGICNYEKIVWRWLKLDYENDL